MRILTYLTELQLLPTRLLSLMSTKSSNTEFTERFTITLTITAYNPFSIRKSYHHAISSRILMVKASLKYQPTKSLHVLARIDGGTLSREKCLHRPFRTIPIDGEPSQRASKARHMLRRRASNAKKQQSSIHPRWKTCHLIAAWYSRCTSTTRPGSGGWEKLQLWPS